MRRIIKLVSIKDENVYDFVDTGYDREGNTTSQRASLQRVLSKRVGDEKGALPIFRVVDVGPWMGGPEGREKRVADGAAPNPEWDDQWLYQESENGREMRGPTPAWRKAQAANVARNKARADEAEQAVNQRIAADIGAGVVDLARRMGAKDGATKEAKRV